MANPSKAHLAAFGQLIHHYASAETGLKICLSGILNVNLGLTLILAEPYSALNLRNVIKSIAKMHEWKPGQLDRLMQIVGDLAHFAPLRNHIAHSRWTSGTRRGAIKPRGIDIRSGCAKFIGDDLAERDWTAAEIEACAIKIADINRRIVRFNQDNGLADRIKRNMEQSKDETD